MAKEIDCEGTNEIICPYCGYEHGDSWELQKNEGEYECCECGKLFNYTRNIEVSYSTTKDCEKNNEQHVWPTNPTFTHKGKNFVTCEKCSKYKEI